MYALCRQRALHCFCQVRLGRNSLPQAPQGCSTISVSVALSSVTRGSKGLNDAFPAILYGVMTTPSLSRICTALLFTDRSSCPTTWNTPSRGVQSHPTADSCGKLLSETWNCRVSGASESWTFLPSVG